MEGVISPDSIEGFPVRRNWSVDPLLAGLCRAHPKDIPSALAKRLMKATEESRERQRAMDALILEQEAEREKRRHLAELTKEIKEIEYAQSPIKTIRAAVCAAYGVSLQDLLSQRRTRDLTLPRHVAYYLAKELTHFSLPMIGRHMGGRDHTTILHGCRKIAAKLLTDQNLAIQVSELIATLSQKEAA